MTYEGWGCEDSNIENETMTIERVEVWQCDAEDEAGEWVRRQWVGPRLLPQMEAAANAGATTCGTIGDIIVPRPRHDR